MVEGIEIWGGVDREGVGREVYGGGMEKFVVRVEWGGDVGDGDGGRGDEGGS